MTIPNILKKPSAFLPVALSLAALAVVLVHVAIFGTAREADEGVAAHLWQLLMAAQLPFLFSSPSGGCRSIQNQRCW
jgi:uncharacterized membrane protein